MGTLATHLALSQVKIYGAGRSRILQALARRPETLSYHGPEKEKRNNSVSPASGRNPGASEPALPQAQPGPLSPQHEA